MPHVETGNLEPAIRRRVEEEAARILKLIDGLNQPALTSLPNSGQQRL